MKTIQENERDHILAVLKKCNGKIWEPGAAAEMLNLLPSMLKSRMEKLGIKKVFIEQLIYAKARLLTNPLDPQKDEPIWIRTG